MPANPQKSLIAALIIAAGAVIFFSFCTATILNQRKWSRLYREMDSSLRNLEPTHPQAIDPAVWERARGCVMTAHCNVCTREGTPTSEMYRLQADLDSKLAQEIDLDTLRWILDRFSRTGPRDKQYMDRFGPMFRECFPPVAPR